MWTRFRDRRTLDFDGCGVLERMIVMPLLIVGVASMATKVVGRGAAGETAKVMVVGGNDSPENGGGFGQGERDQNRTDGFGLHQHDFGEKNRRSGVKFRRASTPR